MYLLLAPVSTTIEQLNSMQQYSTICSCTAGPFGRAHSLCGGDTHGPQGVREGMGKGVKSNAESEQVLAEGRRRWQHIERAGRTEEKAQDRRRSRTGHHADAHSKH
mmetsp:Transcript_14125/g.20101  ORF Transcript_14125/g.20101 Transcript_14125/m.20101 type:complete len:106 (+) Transcript_14125:95-412(+)